MSHTANNFFCCWNGLILKRIWELTDCKQSSMPLTEVENGQIIGNPKILSTIYVQKKHDLNSQPYSLTKLLKNFSPLFSDLKVQ